MFKSINGGILPQRATRYSAGFDVFANEDVVIGAGETKVINLGISIDHDFFTYEIAGVSLGNDGSVLNDGNSQAVESFLSTHYFMLCLRSSLGAKGLILPSGHGVIDLDYKDEVKMIIHNPITSILVDTEDLDNGYAEVSLKGATMNNFVTSENYKIKKGDKIGQLILCRHEGCLLPSEYTKDEERTGGFGSTDKGAQ